LENLTGRVVKGEIVVYMNLINRKLNFEQLFDSTNSKNNNNNHNTQKQISENDIFELSGLVCYYGKHFNAFSKIGTTDTWSCFDDTVFQTVGYWNNVIHKCQAGKLLPFVLWYAKKIG